MSKPNPEQFARVVLWNLSAARAEIAGLHAQFEQMQKDIKHPASDEWLKFAEKKTTETTKFLYEKACKEVGLLPDPPSA